MKKTINIIMLCCLATAVHVQGQEVSFVSSDVEEAIRQHLNVSGEENITFAQLDTITTLDLSKRNITDIHDLLLLPNLRSVSLNNNMVGDLQPLTMLDSLEWVDLSYNSLKTVNELVFSNSKKMTVNVAFNYIGDFSIFGSMTRCNFVFEGSTLQLKEDAPYFNVSQLYCDASASPVVVYGLVRTNMSEPVLLRCGDNQMEVTANGTGFAQTLQGEPSKAVPVYLNNGVKGDSTFWVPPADYELEPNQVLSIATSLPDKYTIRVCSLPQEGALEVNGTNIVYTASDTFCGEDLIYAYYWGPLLKGFSKIELRSGAFLLGDVNADKKVSVADVMMTVGRVLGNQRPGFRQRAADINGDGNITVSDVMGIVKISLGYH